MDRFERFKLNRNRNLWESSSDDDDDDEHHKKTVKNKNKNNNQDDPINIQTTTQSIQRNSSFSTDEITVHANFLSAYPSFDQSTKINLQDHLLLANTPRQLLNKEQGHRYCNGHNFQALFQMIDKRNESMGSSFFYKKYRELYADLSRRLHINDAIIDYNYKRLLECFDIMTNERIHYGFQKHSLTNGDVLPIHEYAVALEFFVQFDLNIFFMKTCSFRGANASLSTNYNGIFCIEQPFASYEMTACKRSYCNFCFPPSNIPQRSHEYQSKIQFHSTQVHLFLSGYRSILNCPVTCQTNDILYVLTCPCGQYDYIGYTSMTLDQRLRYHREHGNRIIHEFILGSKNILQIQTQPKSNETLVKDDMLLYKHSARCPTAMQLFLDCNPQYWSFVPMLEQEAQKDNQSYQLPHSVPRDPSSLLITSSNIRSDHEAGCCMTNLPPLPSNKYTFSTRQCAQQFQYFKTKQDYYLPNYNLNLYNAKIIAVLPEYCSIPLARLLEALFITHARTKLNTTGHLENIVMHPMKKTTNQNLSTIDLIANRGDWCCNLQHRLLN